MAFLWFIFSFQIPIAFVSPTEKKKYVSPLPIYSMKCIPFPFLNPCSLESTDCCPMETDRFQLRHIWAFFFTGLWIGCCVLGSHVFIFLDFCPCLTGITSIQFHKDFLFSNLGHVLDSSFRKKKKLSDMHPSEFLLLIFQLPSYNPCKKSTSILL